MSKTHLVFLLETIRIRAATTGRLADANKILKRFLTTMDKGTKRDHEDNDAVVKSAKIDANTSWYSQMYHAKGRLIPKHIYEKLSESDKNILENVKTTCTDLEQIRAAIKLRKQHNLSTKLPDDWDNTKYYIENSLRKVYPYPYIYQTYAKRRWRGLKLLNILKQEFREISDDQLKIRFDLKRIIVNGDPVSHDYVVKDNDIIVNMVHRHELPVLAAPIKKIYEDDVMLVVDKPPSIPIHPCGRYRFNSLISILFKEYNYPLDSIKVCHRLDRLVSGVVLIPKTIEQARKMEKMISSRDVQKEYVCRVEGDFPNGKSEDDGFITVDQPLDIIPGRIGITVVDPTGKPSLTKFKKLNYNGKTSAVLCQPKTGRMHQIRVHLQYLGHPIVNDGMYNCDAFGPERGKGGRYGKTLRQLSSDVIASHKVKEWIVAEESDIIEDPYGVEENQPAVDDQTKNIIQPKQFLSDEEREETLASMDHFFKDESLKELEARFKYQPELVQKDPICRDCSTQYLDPPPRRLFLYLHALRYSCVGWSYESEMPVWASDDWKY